MTDSKLTTSQRELLQRWFDGELEGDEAGRAEQMHASSEAARTFVASLEDLQGAARLAFDQARRGLQDTGSQDTGSADFDPAAIVEAARRAGPITEQPLSELAPMLERHHDGEVTDAEKAVVRRLRRRREDVADYLDRLARLGGAVRAAEEHARRNATFDGLWEGITDELDEESARREVPAYDPEPHQEWLHRYVDGELSERRVDIVEAWMAAGDDRVEATLAALRELSLATRTASEEAVGRADFGAMWEGLSEAIEAEAPGAGGQADAAEIVDFDAARRSRGAGEAKPADTDSAAASERDGEREDGWSVAADEETEGAPVHWLVDHQQSVLGAVAAALLLVGFGAFFGNRLLQNGPAGQQSPIVIVDSVEYGSGSSVLVDGPTGESAERSKSAPADDDDESSEQDDQKPTVIWLLDSESKKRSDQPETTHEPAGAPAQQDTDAGHDGGGPASRQ